MNQGEPLELEVYMPRAIRPWLAAAAVPDKAVRQAVLRQAAWLGMDLLGGEEVKS